MLKRSLLVLSVVGLMTAGAAAQVPFELVVDTGFINPANESPALPEVGPMFPVTISAVNNTGADLPIAAVAFDFDDPSGNLNWDLDTGFAWEPWLDGSNHPDFGLQVYFATINPPQTAALGLGATFAYSVPAGGSAPLATLMMSGKEEGKFDLTLGVPNELLVDENTLLPVDIGNSNVQTISVLPEPATLGLLGLGGLMFWRRRRQ